MARPCVFLAMRFEFSHARNFFIQNCITYAWSNLRSCIFLFSPRISYLFLAIFDDTYGLRLRPHILDLTYAFATLSVHNFFFKTSKSMHGKKIRLCVLCLAHAIFCTCPCFFFYNPKKICFLNTFSVFQISKFVFMEIS